MRADESALRVGSFLRYLDWDERTLEEGGGMERRPPRGRGRILLGPWYWLEGERKRVLCGPDAPMFCAFRIRASIGTRPPETELGPGPERYRGYDEGPIR